MIKLIICDMDGTVVDSMGLLKKLGVNMLALVGHTPTDAAERHYESTVGQPFIEQVHSWSLKHSLGQSSQFIAECYSDIHRMAAPHFPLTEFGRDLIAFPHELGEFRFALVSSTHEAIIREMPIIEIIPWLHVGGYLPPMRNKIVQIHSIMRDLGYVQTEVAYVGDSPLDRELATVLRIPFFDPDGKTIERVRHYNRDVASVHDHGDSASRLMGA